MERGFKMIKLVSIIYCSLIIFTAFAQEGKNPCSSPEAGQFDFWIGEWNLTWGEDGTGTNIIEKILIDCVILENFDGTASIKLKGMSVSTYNTQLGKWQQTWVDNSGSYLDFIGEFKDGKMTLSRQLIKNGKKIMQRMVWYNISDDKMDWNWEKSEDDGKTWEVLWKIHYQRKK